MDRRFWFQGGLFLDAMHAMQRRGVFVWLRHYACSLRFLSCVGLMLCLAWWLPRSADVVGFVRENSLLVAMLLLGLMLGWLLLWKLPQWQVAAVIEVKDRIDLEWKARQTLIQTIGGIGILIGLFYTAATYRMAQDKDVPSSGRRQWSNLVDRITPNV